jgi:hypothetical protein
MVVLAILKHELLQISAKLHARAYEQLLSEQEMQTLKRQLRSVRERLHTGVVKLFVDLFVYYNTGV